MKKFIFLALMTIALLGVGSFGGKTFALSGSEFQAGRIIDDGVFFNGASMSPSEIQNFFNSKVPVCDNNGTQPYGGTTRAAHGTSRGYPPPYTCLKDYSQSTPSKSPEAGLCGQYNGGTKSAAQIIHDVGQACGISPKILIVLLQKEQSLITDSWPWEKHYNAATGYACPDTASCNPEYSGFFNQVYYAARQFKRYSRDASNYSHKAYRDNVVRFHPNEACGASWVFINNQATAGLYNYTPYRPNEPALNNLYGSGDACSAYGNRNFWRMYQDWFGTTFSDLFSATFYRQSTYPTLYPGETKNIFVDFKNNGNWDWHDDGMSWPGIPPIHLAATRDINRSSMFSFGWPSSGRPNLLFTQVFESDGVTLASNQNLVKPGQIGRFEFNVTAPWNLSPGTYREHFQPVLEGSDAWNIGGLAWFDITVKPRYSAQFYSQSAFPSISRGQSQQVFISYKNVGGDWWYDDISRPHAGVTPIHLATTKEINRQSMFSFGWPSSGRPNLNFSKVYESNGTTLSSDQHTVKPGQIGRFEFNVTAPWNLSPGAYREHFQPVPEGSNKWQIQGLSWLDITVN